MVKRLGFFIRTWVLFFLFLGERAGRACSILSETLSYSCTERNFKHLILHVSAFEGGIFANVSAPGEKLLLLYIVYD